MKTIRATSRPIGLEAADGNVIATEECDVWTQELQTFITAYLPVKAPPLISLGRLCIESGFTYHWDGPAPFLQKRDDDKFKFFCEVVYNVPMIATARKKKRKTVPAAPGADASDDTPPPFVDSSDDEKKPETTTSGNEFSIANVHENIAGGNSSQKSIAKAKAKAKALTKRRSSKDTYTPSGTTHNVFTHTFQKILNVKFATDAKFSEHSVAASAMGHQIACRNRKKLQTPSPQITRSSTRRTSPDQQTG